MESITQEEKLERLKSIEDFVNKAELKPCPFCGGKAELIIAPDNGWGVVCRGECESQTCSWVSPKKAAAVWNRRAVPENKPLTIEQLKQMDGQAVWISEKDKRSRIGKFGLVDTVGNRIVFNRSSYTTFKATAGKTAYARKPEQEEES